MTQYLIRKSRLPYFQQIPFQISKTKIRSTRYTFWNLGYDIHPVFLETIVHFLDTRSNETSYGLSISVVICKAITSCSSRCPSSSSHKKNSGYFLSHTGFWELAILVGKSQNSNFHPQVSLDCGLLVDTDS